MNTELFQKINQIGKGGIVCEGIFVRFPDLLPAVREHYWREDGRHGKLLFIGESNYFNDNDIPQSDFLDAELWYRGAEAKLIPENRKKDVNNGYLVYRRRKTGQMLTVEWTRQMQEVIEKSNLGWAICFSSIVHTIFC